MTGSDVLAIAFGMAVALTVFAMDRLATLRMHQRARRANREAMASESAVLATLDPDSPTALRLRHVIETRATAYVGLAPVRPAFRRSIAFATFFAVATAGSVALLAGASTPAERWGPLFTATACGSFCALIVRSVVRTRHRLARLQARLPNG